MFTPGTELEGLLVEAELPATGESRLFRAVRRGPLAFQRAVTVKVARDEHAGDPRSAARLLAEAIHASSVAHPNVRAVERVGSLRGRTYLVLEHVEGCSVADLLGFLRARRRRLRPELAVHLAVQVASALHATHECRPRGSGSLCLLHRDVSPANLLVARSGHVKLIDFGAADHGRRSGPEARGPRLAGREGYTSPEEQRGEEVNRTTDVYALAACLWELLTLRPAEDAGSRAPRDPAGVPRGAPISPGRLASSIPSALDRVLLRAMAPCPEDRYPTARAFRHALIGAMPGTLLVEEAEVAGLVAEVLAHLPPLSPASATPASAPVTSVLDRRDLEALRRRAREPSDERPRGVASLIAPRRLAALALVSLGVGVITGAAWRSGAAPRVATRERLAPSVLLPTVEGRPLEEVAPSAPPARQGGASPRPAEVPLPAAPPRPQGRARPQRPLEEEGEGGVASAPPADDWPLAVVDELGPWDPVTRGR